MGSLVGAPSQAEIDPGGLTSPGPWEPAPWTRLEVHRAPSTQRFPFSLPSRGVWAPWELGGRIFWSSPGPRVNRGTPQVTLSHLDWVAPQPRDTILLRGPVSSLSASGGPLGDSSGTRQPGPGYPLSGCYRERCFPRGQSGR